MIRYLLITLGCLIVSGCGDTINNTTTTAPTSNLVIKSGVYSVYSSTFGASRLYSITGIISYDGDPQGATMYLEGGVGNVTKFGINPTTALFPDKKMSFYSGYIDGAMPINTFDTYYCTLTDPHGIDSNRFKLTFQ